MRSFMSQLRFSEEDAEEALLDYSDCSGFDCCALVCFGDLAVMTHTERSCTMLNDMEHKSK